jgi:UDP-glucose 4-epimerase
MTEIKEELETKFKKMLQSIEDSLGDDTILQEDLKNFEFKLQWNIYGMKAYQKFNNGDYSYGFGEEIENPDLTLESDDADVILKLLNREIGSYTYMYYKRKFKLYYIEGWEKVEVDGETLKSKKLRNILTARYSTGTPHHPFVLTRLPVFRDIVDKWYEPEMANGSYIPINDALGTFEDQILPLKVLEHFINKSNHFLLFHSCGCRVFHECKDHDVEIGCMYLGEDVVGIEDVFPKVTPDRAHLGTKEEALERVRLAYENGLITVIGRLKLESEGMGIPDRGRFMTVCFCCPCCCINGKWRYGTTEFQNIIQRIEGVTVTVDENLCVGCEECMEVCVFNGMDMIDGIAKVNQEKCLGCGRCERVCQNEAISITIDDPKRLDEFIRRIEANVDVS